MDTPNFKGRSGFCETYRACVDGNDPQGQIIEIHQLFFS
jgi:hypothetical protein